MDTSANVYKCIRGPDLPGPVVDAVTFWLRMAGIYFAYIMIEIFLNKAELVGT